MATGTENEQQLKLLFENAVDQIKEDKGVATDQIQTIQILAKAIAEKQLATMSDICALIATEMKPRLAKIGIEKGDRWFRKYLDAKYKRPQKAEQPPRTAAKPAGGSKVQKSTKLPAKIMPAVGESLKKAAEAMEKLHGTHLRVNVYNPQDEGRVETHKEGFHAFTVEDINNHITKDGRKKCLECHHLHADSWNKCHAVNCKCTEFVDPQLEAINLDLDTKDEKVYFAKTVEAAVAKTEEKATSEARVADDAEAIVPFATFHAKSGVGFAISWNKVPTFMECQNPICHHHKVKHGLFATKGQHKCQEPGCACKDFVIDTRKLPESERKKLAAGARDGGPAATPKKKAKKQTPLEKQIADQQAVINVIIKGQQVERTREEGYGAYEGDASKKLDQPHILDENYSVHEIMATSIYTYTFDPVDKKSNTKVCSNCGSSKLDWTEIVMRKWDQDEGAIYLQEANMGGRVTCPNIGFFQCNTCHAFLIADHDVPFVTVEKQEDGSYKLKQKEPAADPLLKDHPEIKSTAIISIDLKGELATPENILKELVTGPALKKTDALYAVQQALLATTAEEMEEVKKALKAKSDHLSTVLQDNNHLREQIKEAKKELAERATKEESDKVDLLKRELEEYKSENDSLKKQLVSASFTTADKIHDFEIFIPKKVVAELVKTIDTMNWKKAPGISVRTDGKFGNGFKVGAPE